MADAGSTSADTSPPRRMADGLDTPFGGGLADQVSVEADRVSGTIAGGVEAAKAAAQTYGALAADGYARMVQSSMRSGADLGDHLAALMLARTPFEFFELNSAFFRKQASALPSRFLEMMGLDRAAPAGRRP